MATMQQVIDLARLDLNDEDKARHYDRDLIKYASTGLQELVKTRPDLFSRILQNLPDYSIGLSDTFPLPDRYIRACADYVAGRAKMRNTEESSLQEAGAYLSLAAKESGIN